MAVFAEIVLVTTLCLSADGLAVSGDSCSDEWIPESWESSNVVEAAKDWQDCLDMQAKYLALPEYQSANCRYSELGGERLANQ